MRTATFTLALAFLAFAGCSRAESDAVQGYVEGEYVYVAAPYSGALESLFVQRGAQINAKEPLFALEASPEQSLRDEARRRVAQARSNLEDLKKGRRPTEIESLEAQLRQARAALVFSESELVRMENTERTGAGSVDDTERIRSKRNQEREKVAQLEADLKTARLGSRDDQIAAAEANVTALEATLAKAEWDLSQKQQFSQQAGLVFDTLYREGEWVAAGRPVVVLLPPQNIKVRAFVPEQRVGTIRPGGQVQVFVDGAAEPFIGRVSYISPRAEYTPPVIYSRESRSKLVFMVEVVFEPTSAAKLHPGQPVDVRFGQ